MLTQVAFLLKHTHDSSSFLKVKKVMVGRRRREGWWVIILRDFKVRVE